MDISFFIIAGTIKVKRKNITAINMKFSTPISIIIPNAPAVSFIS